MVTRDVLKVLKLHSPAARAILRTFKTSLVPINHEMHEQVHTISYHDLLQSLGYIWHQCKPQLDPLRSVRFKLLRVLKVRLFCITKSTLLSQAVR